MKIEPPAFLIVDDNVALRMIMTRVIRKVAPDAVVHGVDSVHDALAALAAARWSALIVDYRLPDGDGLDVIRWVREQDLLLPVVAMSGLNVDREMQAMGAHYVLNKPFPIDQLMAIVRTILEELPTV